MHLGAAENPCAFLSSDKLDLNFRLRMDKCTIKHTQPNRCIRVSNMPLTTLVCHWHTCIKQSRGITGMLDTRIRPYTAVYGLLCICAYVAANSIPAIHLRCPFAVHPTKRHQCHHTNLHPTNGFAGRGKTCHGTSHELVRTEELQ